MIVRVRSKDGPNLFIPLPTGLFLNGFTAGIAARSMAHYGAAVTPSQMRKLFRIIRECKRRHPDWVLAEVHSADGDHIYVKL